jgi:hypothetical protein
MSWSDMQHPTRCAPPFHGSTTVAAGEDMATIVVVVPSQGIGDSYGANIQNICSNKNNALIQIYRILVAKNSSIDANL